jgi:hypothetical protein
LKDISRSPKQILIALIGFPFAATGCLLTFLPYQLCNLIVKHFKKYDMAKEATFKVVYSLFLFPITFLIEAMFLYMLFSWMILIPFLIIIIPLSYFTLYFIEWLYENGWGIPITLYKFRKKFYQQILKQLEDHSSSIKNLIDTLAERLD